MKRRTVGTPGLIERPAGDGHVLVECSDCGPLGVALVGSAVRTAFASHFADPHD